MLQRAIRTREEETLRQRDSPERSGLSRWRSVSSSRVLMALCSTRSCAFFDQAFISLSGRSPAAAPFLRRRQLYRNERQCDTFLQGILNPRVHRVKVHPTRHRGPPGILGCEAPCRASGLLTGAGYPVITSRKRRTVHASGRQPLPIPSSGGKSR